MRIDASAATSTLCLLLLSPPAALADGLPPETGLVAEQLVLGAATASVAMLVPIAAQDTPYQPAGFVSLLAGPAAVGGLVCIIGQGSKHYTGGCSSTMIGAYVGALASLPLALLGAQADDDAFDGGDDGSNFFAGRAIGFMVGYVVGTAVGATIGWHASKEERGAFELGTLAPPSPPPPLGDDWPELRRRPGPATRDPSRTNVWLAAFSF